MRFVTRRCSCPALGVASRVLTSLNKEQWWDLVSGGSGVGGLASTSCELMASVS